MAAPILLLPSLLAILNVSLQPQMPDSAWPGTLKTPDGRTMAISVHVASSLPTRLVIVAPGPGNRMERFEARDIGFQGRQLRFVFDPQTPAQCELTVAQKGGYEGRCRDARNQERSLEISAPVPGMLFPEHEIVLARSAAPPHVADSADVLVLGPGGYASARKGSTGFVCLIDRPRPADLWPVCYDPEGAARIVPVALARGALRAQGASEKAIADTVARGFQTGRFQPARRTGVAYMLSTFGRSVNPETGQSADLTPHLMMYAPYLQRADIGVNTADRSLGSLGVNSAGTPHAYIIVRLTDDTPTGRP